MNNAMIVAPTTTKYHVLLIQRSLSVEVLKSHNVTAAEEIFAAIANSKPAVEYA